MKLSADYLEWFRERYRKSGRVRKGQLLDEFCELSKCHRKSALRLLGRRKVGRPASAGKRGRKSRYDRKEFRHALRRVWFCTDQMCSKLLKAAMPKWLPYVEQHYGELGADVREDLLRISPSTIDRILKPVRVLHGRSKGGTKPGNMLRTEIPVRAGVWEEEHPGFLEADTVAHCGNSLAGMFVWSLTMTDIASHWTENRAVWHKGAQGVVREVRDIEKHLPFELLGFDCDNGGEFINQYLKRYFTEDHPRRGTIQFTRSREYKKNDNAHVEQRNWSHPRQLFGRERIDFIELVEVMNDIYRNEFSLLRNHFYPTLRLISKRRVNSRYQRIYGKPMTPYDRVIADAAVTADRRQALEALHHTLNPIALKIALDDKLKRFWKLLKALKQSRLISTEVA